MAPGNGDLSVNQGQGFKPVDSRIEANVGDSVMVGPGGAATVVYGDGSRSMSNRAPSQQLLRCLRVPQAPMLKIAGRVIRMTQAVAERTGRPTDSGPSG